MSAHRGMYAVTIFLTLLTLGTSVAFPQMIRAVIDEGIQAGAVDRVYFWLWAMSALVIVQASAQYLRNFVLAKGSIRITTEIRAYILRQAFDQEFAFFDKKESDLLPNRLMADIGTLQNVVGTIVPEIVQGGLRLFIAGGLMIYTSPLLSVAVAMIGPTLAYGSSKISRRIRRQADPIQAAGARLTSRTRESLSGVLTVKTYDHQEKTIEEHNQLAQNLIDTARPQMKSNAFLTGYTNLLSEGAVVVAISVGAMLILSNQLTPGLLVTFILYAGLVSRGAATVSEQSAQLMSAQGSTNTLFALAERETKMPPVETPEPKECRGAIEVQSVHFSYPEGREFAAVKGVDFSIKAGEEVALVGVSGCGKSTLAKLICRLYDPDQGKICLDGHPLPEINTRWLRSKISLVPPEPVIFTTTLAENIRYGRTDATDEEVRWAAEQAQAAGFIEELPEAYETIAEDAGAQFSSGQRQRIAIARAILRRAQILILDESTAALDTRTESEVKKSLRALPHNPTLILISHRLSTIVDVERVIALDQGRIVASGPHHELLKTSHFYSELVQDQLITE